MTDSPRNEQRELPTLSTTLLQRIRDMNPDGWSRLVEVFGPIVARGIGDFERQKSSGSFRS